MSCAKAQRSWLSRLREHPHVLYRRRVPRAVVGTCVFGGIMPHCPITNSRSYSTSSARRMKLASDSGNTVSRHSQSLALIVAKARN